MRKINFAYVVLFASAALMLTTVTLSFSASAAEVNMYSQRQPFLMDPLLKAFTKETGIKVNMVYIKKVLLERLKAEGANSPADLVTTSDIGNLHNLLTAGLLQATKSSIIERNIPAQYRHPEGLWYGLTTRARIIYAHKNRVEPGEITTYEDLADPKMKGRICIRSGKNAYNVSLLAWMIATRGEEAAKAWASGLKANLARKPQGNDRAQVKGIYQGECDVSVGNTYYMGKMVTNEKEPEQKDWAASVKLIFPNQNSGGTHVNISGAGMTKSAPNKKNAIKLIEFLSGNSAQKIYAEDNFEYPVKVGTTIHPLVASWGKFKADSAHLEKIAMYRTRATQIMDEVRFDN